MKIIGAIMNARHVMDNLYEVQLPSGMWFDEPLTWEDLQCWDGFVYVIRDNYTEAMSKATFNNFAYEAEDLKPVIHRLDLDYAEDYQ